MRQKKSEKPTREQRRQMREKKRAEKKEQRRIKREKTVLTARERAMYEKQQRKRIRLVAYVAVTLVVYLCIILIIAFGVFLSIWMTKRTETTVVTTSVSVDSESDKQRVKVIYENNVPYISISFLEQYGEVIHAGDYAARTIRFTDTGDSAVFSINSSFCTINQVDVNLSAPVLLREGELYLPLEFYRVYVKGISFEGDGRNVDISAEETDLGYKIKPASVTVQIPEEAAGSLLEFTTQTPEFLSDLSAYERYMNPGETTEFLTLVNLDNGISETFRPGDLTGVEDRNAAYPGGDYHAKLRLYAAKSLDAMLEEARANGFSGLQATSGYRSYAEQRYRFNNLVTSIINDTGVSEAEAEAEAVKVVQKPGYSEYQTGLCADVRFPNDDIDTFKDTDAAKWLEENCYKFGFILRYPESKTESTGMESQSWHFRYVGRYHAIRIKYLDMSLEEYHVFMGLDETKLG